MIESVLLFLAVIVVLLAGYPVAFTLAGTAILFAVIGLLTGNFEIGYLNALPSRLFGIMTNETLIAVPLFIFMGITLERAKIAEDLLETLSCPGHDGSLNEALGTTNPQTDELDAVTSRTSGSLVQVFEDTVQVGWFNATTKGREYVESRSRRLFVLKQGHQLVSEWPSCRIRGRDWVVQENSGDQPHSFQSMVLGLQRANQERGQSRMLFETISLDVLGSQGIGRRFTLSFECF